MPRSWISPLDSFKTHTNRRKTINAHQVGTTTPHQVGTTTPGSEWAQSHRTGVSLAPRLYLTHQRRNGERRAKNSAITSKTSGDNIALCISFCSIDDTLRKATLRRLAIRQAVLQRHRRAYLWTRNMNLFLCSIVSPLSSEWQGEGVLT